MSLVQKTSDFDDKSQYTGVYEHGGPTNIGAGGDGEAVTLAA